MKIRTISLFSGLGSFEKALENLKIDYEIVYFSEIDKKIGGAYSCLHNVCIDKNLGDITQIDLEKLKSLDIDLLTWGFPCVSFSKANKSNNRLGLDGKSGLYYKGFEVFKTVKPKYSIIENVSDLITDPKFESHYQLILSDLQNEGYTNYTFLLNASDYNIPQNRKRVFIISVRNDIDKKIFQPAPVPLKLKAKYLFDDSVDEKFYNINPKIIESIKSHKCRSLDIVPTITRAIGRAGSSKEYIANCSFVYQNTGELRRMTPCECMKFIGYTDEDFKKLKSNNVSDTTIYNMSGNAIAIPIIEKFFTQLFIK